MAYATGRGMEYYDEETVDRIAQRLSEGEGKFSALLTGIIDSAPFQSGSAIRRTRFFRERGTIRSTPVKPPAANRHHRETSLKSEYCRRNGAGV